MFEPDGALEPATEYRSVVIGEECNHRVSFSTSSVGTPVAWDQVADRTFAFRLTDARIVRPEGSFEDLDGVVLVRFLASEAAPRARVGVLAADGAAQDTCSPTFETPITWSSPYFELEIPEHRLRIDGTSVDLKPATIAGDFTPTGTAIAAVAVSGVIDGRATYPDVETFFQAAGFSFAVTCEACSDGTEACMTIDADLLPGASSDIDVVTVEETCGD